MKNLIFAFVSILLVTSPIAAQQGPGKAAASKPTPVASPEPMTMLALAGGAAAAGGVLSRRRRKDEE